MKRKRKDTADFQRIRKSRRMWWQPHLTWGAREGGQFRILGSRRTPGDHKQPWSLKGGCKNCMLEAVQCPSKQSSSTLTPSTCSWAKSCQPQTVTQQAKGKLPVDKTSPSLVKPCPKTRLCPPEISFFRAFRFRTFLQHNCALSAGNNSN